MIIQYQDPPLDILEDGDIVYDFLNKRQFTISGKTPHYVSLEESKFCRLATDNKLVGCVLIRKVDIDI